MSMKNVTQINYQNRRPGGWDDYFHVRGGPFSTEQIMGWHVTDQNGYTLAVSPSHDFVQFCQKAKRFIELMKLVDARYNIIERRDQGYMDSASDADWQEFRSLLDELREATP